MKKVFQSNSDVIHAFCQQNQNEGRTGNVFFYGTKIYSYGYHYLLGEFITNKSGVTAIMINNTGYSNSTAKHINYLTSASRQYKQFFVLHTNETKVLSQLTDLKNKLINARKPEKYISEANYLYSKYIEFCEWSTAKPNKDIVKIHKVFNDNEAKAKAIEYEKNKLASLKRKNAKILKENLIKFNNYEISRFGNEEDFLRISVDNNFVETSQSVKVSISEAKILYKMILDKKDIKGFRIGSYTVTGLNGVLKIGCHRINVNNMHEVGQKIINL